MNIQKIAFIISGLRIGGAEKVCVALANKFHQNGFNVSLIVLNLDDAELLKHVDSGISLYNLNVRNARKAMLPLKKVLGIIRPNKCLSFNFQISVQLVIIRKLFGIRYTLYSRGVNTFSEKVANESSFRHKYVNPLLIKSFYKKSDFFIAQSTGMKIDMVKSLSVPEKKIRVIFNPAFSFKNSVSGEETNKETSTNREILFVGTLKQQKNLPFLLKSVSELSKMRNDFLFRIVGDGKLRETLEKEAEKLGIKDKVIFEGISYNPAFFYKKADVFVLGSWYEGFPNVLIEALSFGIPIVSIDCMSGPADIIENGVNGFLVEEYNSEKFAVMISKVLDANWDEQKIKETANKFSLDTIFQQYRDYLTSNEKN